MLIVRSPLRISLSGGGTDLPVFYREYGGRVINVAIDRYFYVFLRTSGHEAVHIASANLQTYDNLNRKVADSWKEGLELPRAIFHHFGITSGVNLFLASEVPAGTGLGSSSTVAVGLIKALATASGIDMSKAELAELASYIEIEKLGSPIGKQDQDAAAFGGINLIEFEDARTTVTPLELSPERIQVLVNHLLLFYTGNKRKANEILHQQKEASKKKKGAVVDALQRVKEMVFPVKAILEEGSMTKLGEFLHLNWVEKKRFAKGVSNVFLDKCYDLALREGAWGGKVTGAGGGGFLLFCCPPEKQEAVTKTLAAEGLQQLCFSVDNSGARVLMNAGLRLTSRQSWISPEKLRRRI